jgi:hypothetical protein
MQPIDYYTSPRRRSRVKIVVAWSLSVLLIGIAVAVALGHWMEKVEADFQNSRWQYYKAHPELRSTANPTTASTQTAATTRR